MTDARGANVSGLHVLAAASGGSQVRVTGLYVLAACVGQAKQATVSEIYGLAAILGTGRLWPRVTQMATLVMYDTGVPDAKRSRAWAFQFDGHSFYVLDLGEEGTWLYDFSSGQWSRFETRGYDGQWNAKLGVYWEAKRATVVSDAVNGYLHIIDPEQPLDEAWRPIEYTVTGGVEVHHRNAHTHESFRLQASVGAIADPLGATLTFRFSDDQGKTWRATYTATLTPQDWSQELAWRSLGIIRAPGRLFEVTSTGGLIRIDAANAEIDGMNDDTP